MKQSQQQRANLYDKIMRQLEQETEIPDRIAEIRNIRTGLSNMLSGFPELYPEDDECAEILKEVHHRLQELTKDPYATGKHGRIHNVKK